jgi:hypothetical protein
VKRDRDLSRARQRYLRLSKRELVGRLAVEQACDEHEERWLPSADELFPWMLLVGRA